METSKAEAKLVVVASNFGECSGAKGILTKLYLGKNGAKNIECPKSLKSERPWSGSTQGT